jgi:hypothetical protein
VRAQAVGTAALSEVLIGGETAAKRGSALLIEGPPGVGRSRLLDASVLTGKLQGLTVVRADADDAEQGDYGAMRALVAQLQRQLPDATRAASQPDLAVLETLNHAAQARFRGHYERACLAYRALLERTAAPDRGGLTEAHHRYMQLIVTNGIAIIEASMGLRTSLARRVTVIRIQSSGRSTFENAHLVWQVMAHAAVEDLTRLKRTVDEIQIAAADHAGWQPVLAYATYNTALNPALSAKSRKLMREATRDDPTF